MEAGTDISNAPHISQLQDVESDADSLRIHTLPSLTGDHLSNQISTDATLPSVVPFSASRAGSPSHIMNEIPVAIAWDAEGDAGNLSRSGTPENEDLWHDEPSSVLASKIIRAHDNPSPPPLSPNLNTSISAPLIDFSASPVKFSAAAANASESVSNNVPAAPSPSLQPEIPDLLSVDDIPSLMQHIDTHATEPNGIFSPPVLPSLSSLPSPPSRSSDGSDFPLVDLHSPLKDEDTSTHRETESIVDDVLGQVEDELRSLGVEAEKLVVPPSSHQDGTPDEPVPSDASESSLFQTPLRRSTRPRRGTPRAPEHAEQASITPVAPLSIQRKKGKQKAEDSDSLDAAPPTPPAPEESKGSKRELSSLSPTSDHLVSSLVPTPERTSPNPLSSAKDLTPTASSTNITQFTFPIPSTPLRTAPVRVLNPLWSGASPSKAGMDDPTRTPARRIPVEQAAVQAHVALREAKTFFVHHTPGSKRATGSPAKRHIPQASVFKPSQERGSSPTRLVPERSKSAEPSPLAPAVTKNTRSTSLEPSLPSQRSLVGSIEALKMGSLPFPLMMQPSIPEETGMGDSTGSTNVAEKAAAQSTTLATSSLKQTTTKIPRIANKPYARPGPGKGVATSKLPVRDAKALTPVAKVAEQPKVKPPIAKPKQRVVEKPTLVARSAFPIKPPDVPSNSATIAPSLKRKRNVPAPPVIKPKPIPVVRQVPNAPSKSQPISSGVAPKAIATNRATGVNNRSGPTLRVRRVVDKKQPPPSQPPSLSSGEQAQSAPPRSPSPPPSVPPEAQNTSTMQGILPSKDSIFSPVQEFGVPTTGAQISETDDSQVQLGISSRQNGAPDQEPQTSLPLNESVTNIPPAPQPSVPDDKSTLRRTTRGRKIASQTLPDDVEDVFRDKSTTIVQPRRGRGTGSRAGGVREGITNGFAGMTALSLKTLTTTNTTRNQRYMAITLATEVVRKEGLRPASPGMKIKTVLQRQEEEKEKQKQERADRRARRAVGFTAASLVDGDNENMEQSFDGSDDSDIDDHLPVLDLTEEFSIPPGKYRRGAGEEEDYETPDRAYIKRRRLDDGGDGEATCAEKRRVKWDKGLFTTIYLDEIQPGSRRPPAAEVIPKGCLAPTAKSMQLDLMGNPPNAEQPLSDVPQESIVIQRFVYDDELAPTETPPPAPDPRPKNTRTKGKKAKST